MTFEQKKARAIALMDSKKMWRSNYAPPLLCILWRLGIRLPPLPFMPFWQVTLLMGSLWGISWGCAMWFIYWGPSGMGKRKLTAVCSHQTRIGNLDAHLI
ncbi:DUF6404 family protein [Escherichia coli]|uniref:DUF6404 family protein n=1 Tax=Escherichia coli TaxID=562 RepID=UPI0029D4155B|nr:DUF6404 family protein [Escherichia coli]